MSVDFRNLANTHIRNLIPYQPGKPIEEVERELGITAIKLASNENPLGPSPKALLAIHKAMEKLHFYPDGGCYDLKQALAKFLKVSPAQLTIGNGSENILEMIVKAYLSPGSAAIVSQYAFLTMLILIKSYGAELITAPANQFGHDIKNMLAAITENTRVIFIVNPNNPTGTYTNEQDLLLLLDSVPKHILVVVDEAYYEYIDKEDFPDTLKLLNQYPNLIITRTFSKAYSLAALRVGYAISSPEIADILNRARMPFNVNSVAAIAAISALEDQDHVKKSVALNNEGMQQLAVQLKKWDVNFIPSLGNFITIDMKKNANEVHQNLMKKGVIVRPLGAYDLGNFIRVTVGTKEQNEIFLRALENMIKEI